MNENLDKQIIRLTSEKRQLYSLLEETQKKLDVSQNERFAEREKMNALYISQQELFTKMKENEIDGMKKIEKLTQHIATLQNKYIFNSLKEAQPSTKLFKTILELVPTESQTIVKDLLDEMKKRIEDPLIVLIQKLQEKNHAKGEADSDLLEEAEKTVEEFKKEAIECMNTSIEMIQQKDKQIDLCMSEIRSIRDAANGNYEILKFADLCSQNLNLIATVDKLKGEIHELTERIACILETQKAIDSEKQIDTNEKTQNNDQSAERCHFLERKIETMERQLTKERHEHKKQIGEMTKELNKLPEELKKENSELRFQNERLRAMKIDECQKEEELRVREFMRKNDQDKQHMSGENLQKCFICGSLDHAAKDCYYKKAVETK
ncbi:hypothetical protein EIN_486810 [Entamoeba invadens IP1]|uniref:CCHC-type domain-containing protein n=1 Tax=Entamoeba invadens IP1 TaxID=370355 RepID=A0A0A1U4X1_ENTIV|nr:hypothetical protein EIN_486810 [Entamoeba invadens IP1]ELP89219.1 hypothetical protein EIN_486810 [Entamoeba invadens IP1]|eukprot:XP_004255990.1 hypothetical protein EIN_486810 [Entamoeba invadens IP1]